MSERANESGDVVEIFKYEQRPNTNIVDSFVKLEHVATRFVNRRHMHVGNTSCKETAGVVA